MSDHQCNQIETNTGTENDNKDIPVKYFTLCSPRIYFPGQYVSMELTEEEKEIVRDSGKMVLVYGTESQPFRTSTLSLDNLIPVGSMLESLTGDVSLFRCKELILIKGIQNCDEGLETITSTFQVADKDLDTREINDFITWFKKIFTSTNNEEKFGNFLKMIPDNRCSSFAYGCMHYSSEYFDYHDSAEFLMLFSSCDYDPEYQFLAITSTCSNILQNLLREKGNTESKGDTDINLGTEYPDKVKKALKDSRYPEEAKKWIRKMPWYCGKAVSWRVQDIRKEIEATHVGMHPVKDAIEELLAVVSLRASRKGNGTGWITPILFDGPPGVGKTSVAKAIAKVMGRDMRVMSMAGIDAAGTLRGFGRSWSSSEPGAFVKTMSEFKYKNPLIVLDEVDKIGTGSHNGSPRNVLLAALDHGQNSEFIDNYLEFPIDLSATFFIGTSNNRNVLSQPILDRFEVIEFLPYTRGEKCEIAEKHLVPKIMNRASLTKNEFNISDAGIEALTDLCVNEAGVRQLEQLISKLVRKIARLVALGLPVPEVIDDSFVNETLQIEKSNIFSMEDQLWIMDLPAKNKKGAGNMMV